MKTSVYQYVAEQSIAEKEARGMKGKPKNFMAPVYGGLSEGVTFGLFSA